VTQNRRNNVSDAWFGHQEAQKTYQYQGPPQEVNFEGIVIPMFSYSQLSGQGKRNLYERCTSVRDTVGASRLPQLNPAMDRDALILWLLEVELAITNLCTGSSFTFSDFGAPPDVSAQRPSQAASKPTRQAMAYKGLASPFAADYSDANALYQPNSAVKHDTVVQQRDAENHLPQWARERHMTENRGAFGGGAFGGGGILSQMMQAQMMDVHANANAARRRNMSSTVFS